MELLKNWENFEKQYNKVVKEFCKNLEKNLILEHGQKEKNAKYTYGLPYTSSGEFAAIWNTNTQARLKNTNLYFRGLAITEDGATMAYFEEEQENGKQQAYFINITKNAPTSQKVLYIEGAGCAYYGGINCRLRTAFKNNNGTPFYFECFAGHQDATPSSFVCIDTSGVIDGNEIIYDNNRVTLFNRLRKTDYNAANICKLINEIYKTDFIKIEVLEHPFTGYYVHKDGGGFNFGDDFTRRPEIEEQLKKIYDYFYNFEKTTLQKRWPNFSMVPRGQALRVIIHYNCYNDILQINNIFDFNFDYKKPDAKTLQLARDHYGDTSGREV